MKKFTKGCLMTALILFILGAAMCCVFGALGGYRQLKDRNDIYDLGWNGIKFGFEWGKYGPHFGFFSDDEEWYNSHSGAVNIASRSEMEQTDYTVSDFTDIDIEISAVNLIIEESEDDHIWIRNDSSLKTVKYGVENGVFKLYGRKNLTVWDVSSHGSVTLKLPKEMNLNSVEIEFGAGNMDGISLEAHSIDLDAGAGEFNIDNLTADKISMDIGAGEMSVNSLKAGNVTISVGAGTLDIKDADITDMDLDAGVGSVSIKGKVSGDMDVECGIGSVDITLSGYETDHNYDIECAVGDVTIGSTEYSGLASERSINNNSNSNFDIECAAGSIAINFED